MTLSGGTIASLYLDTDMKYKSEAMSDNSSFDGIDTQNENSIKHSLNAATHAIMEKKKKTKKKKRTQEPKKNHSKTKKESGSLNKQESEKQRVCTTRFQCPHCPKLLQKAKYFEKHLLIKHNVMENREYQCYLCRKLFATLVILRNHFKCHSARKYLCTQCGFFAEKPIQLRRHMMRKDHMRSDTVRPHECEICKMRFVVRADLRIHLTSHFDIRDYPCPICGKAFKNKKNLGQHTMTHGEKKHKCQMCDYKCFSPGNLKIHMKVHTGRGGN